MVLCSLDEAFGNSSFNILNNETYNYQNVNNNYSNNHNFSRTSKPLENHNGNKNREIKHKKVIINNEMKQEDNSTISYTPFEEDGDYIYQAYNPIEQTKYNNNIIENKNKNNIKYKKKNKNNNIIDKNSYLTPSCPDFDNEIQNEELEDEELEDEELEEEELEDNKYKNKDKDKYINNSKVCNTNNKKNLKIHEEYEEENEDEDEYEEEQENDYKNKKYKQKIEYSNDNDDDDNYENNNEVKENYINSQNNYEINDEINDETNIDDELDGNYRNKIRKKNENNYSGVINVDIKNLSKKLNDFMNILDKNLQSTNHSIKDIIIFIFIGIFIIFIMDLIFRIGQKLSK